MAASFLSAPTSHFNLNHDALHSASRIPSFSSAPMSISMLPTHSSLHLPHVISAIVTYKKVFKITALAQETEQITEKAKFEKDTDKGPEAAVAEEKTEGKITESLPKGIKLYVGNLPRACDSAQLTQIFEEFGIVESVEVIRNEETGISRGFAYVTMSNDEEALAAIEKLQGYDLDGRDMLVNFPARLLSTGIGCRVYIGNLAWSVKRESIRVLFSQYGNVLGIRLNYDRKDGVPRVYGFVYLSKRTEVEAVVAAVNGKEFHGRKLVVREAEPYKNSEGSDADENILVKPTKIQGDSISETPRNFLTETPYQIFVGNLSRSVNSKAIEELFSQYGTVLDARVLFDRKSGSSRVFGFVSLSSQTEVESAIAALHGKEFQNRALVVKKARVKNQT